MGRHTGRQAGGTGGKAGRDAGGSEGEEEEKAKGTTDGRKVRKQTPSGIVLGAHSG